MTNQITIDKDALCEELKKLTDYASELIAGPVERRGFNMAILTFSNAIYASLPEHEQWITPACDSPKTVADALEALKKQLK